MEEKKKILENMKICIDSINKTIKEVIEKLNGFSKAIIYCYFNLNINI